MTSMGRTPTLEATGLQLETSPTPSEAEVPGAGALIYPIDFTHILPQVRYFLELWDISDEDPWLQGTYILAKETGIIY